MVTADEDKQNADEKECNVHVSFPRCKPHIDSLLASEPKLEAARRARMILRVEIDFFPILHIDIIDVLRQRTRIVGLRRSLF